MISIKTLAICDVYDVCSESNLTEFLDEKDTCNCIVGGPQFIMENCQAAAERLEQLTRTLGEKVAKERNKIVCAEIVKENENTTSVITRNPRSDGISEFTVTNS